MRLRLPTLLALFVLAGTVVTGSVSARPADDDLEVLVQLWKSGRPVAGTRTTPPFKMAFNIDAAAGVIQQVTLTVLLATGLRWGSDGPDPAEGCAGTVPAVCRQGLTVGGGGTVGGGYLWDVVADAPGTYEVTASVTGEQADPNLSNNEHTLRFEVLPVTAPTASASTVSLSPRKPRAGSAVVATVRVAVGGVPVRPTRVACRGAVEGTGVRGTPRSVAGKATCSYRPPRRGARKRFSGTVSLTAGGRRFTRPFSVRLA